jgi:hypothetical protein
VFLEKRLQAVENKAREPRKESKERPKRLQVTGSSRLEAGRWNRKLEGDVPPPWVFCKKSLEVTDLMGVDVLGSAKEFARV